MNTSFSQELIKKDTYTYSDTNGNFFVQKSQPIYLWIGFTKDSIKNLHLLKSDTSANYTNPMYFDEEGLNTIRSPWAVDPATHIRVFPLEVIEFEVYADGIAPKTYLKYGNHSPKHINGINYFGNGLSIKLNSSDKNSGLYNTYYSLDGLPYQIYKEPVKCDKEKSYLIQYYAIDNVGNIEKLKKYKFTIDKTKPVTELTIKGDRHENVLSQNTKIILSPKDELCGVQLVKIKIDNGKYINYKGALNTAYLTQGEHTLYYYAKDYVGNIEDEKSFTFFVDNTAPILVEEVIGNSFMNNGKEYSSGRSKLKLTAVDNKAGVKAIYYKLNDGDYQKYEKPFYLSVISGSLNITSYAIDNVGNKSVSTSNTSRSSITYIDLTGPEISYKLKGAQFKIIDSVYISTNTLIELISTDGESGFKSMDYNIDQGEMKVYTEPFTIKKSGVHHIGATSFDNVNNSNHNEFTFIIDDKGPQIFSRFSILPLLKKQVNGREINVYSSVVSLFLSATDAKVAIDKIYYKINDEAEKQYLGYIGGFKQGIDYTIKIRATDKLGNETFSDIVFATDNSGPEIFTQFSTPVKSQKEIDGKKINVYPSYVSLFLSVTNAHVAYEKIYYSINGNSEKIYTGVIENFKSGSEIKMKIRAVDQLGNQTKKDIEFVIE
ncbi:MAG: hypothetical protein GXO79_10695 [Chlorobi bacterium]|nr:hypothetical protein [Chlorobiota bacterium]